MSRRRNLLRPGQQGVPLVGAFFPAIGAVIVAASYVIAFVITLFLSRREEQATSAPGDERVDDDPQITRLAPVLGLRRW